VRSALLLVADAWTTVFCQQVREAMDHGTVDDAEVLDGASQVDLAVRRAFDVTPDDAWIVRLDEAVAELRPQIATFFNTELTGSVGVSCLRYTEGGRYRRHRDRDPDAEPETAERRVSLIVWVTTASTTTDRGDFDGGALRLYPAGVAPIDLLPRAGAFAAFPSDWPHEVLPVTRGVRDVIVDWLY
jgi:predicted 2-oxoglutarate/Fe(II)-dependent dioxygenase YbiX